MEALAGKPPVLIRGNLVLGLRTVPAVRGAEQRDQADESLAQQKNRRGWRTGAAYGA